MKVIIIEDKDCKALVDQLELLAMRDNGHFRSHDNPDAPASVKNVHKAFHYEVVHWLQRQGWDSR